jgi:hypothetical protein
MVRLADMPAWGTYEADLKRIPADQALKLSAYGIPLDWIYEREDGAGAHRRHGAFPATGTGCAPATLTPFSGVPGPVADEGLPGLVALRPVCVGQEASSGTLSNYLAVILGGAAPALCSTIRLSPVLK